MICWSVFHGSRGPPGYTRKHIWRKLLTDRSEAVRRYELGKQGLFLREDILKLLSYERTKD